jgi:hypothetical protein
MVRAADPNGAAGPASLGGWAKAVTVPGIAVTVSAQSQAAIFMMSPDPCRRSYGENEP